jgi:glycosyltransferase involved in cell wall biosynthesis
VAAVCARYDLVPGRFVSYVGVLEPRKNVPVLIEAYARIVAEYPDVPLVIVGKKGWMYDVIFARVQELGLGERVRSLGYISEADLIALYSGTGAFVYPSRYEGFGLPVLEAMRCGAPVVTSAGSAMAELADGAAELVDPLDAASIAEGIRRAIDRRDELRAAGIARASEFTWAEAARATVAVYREAAR